MDRPFVVAQDRRIRLNLPLFSGFALVQVWLLLVFPLLAQSPNLFVLAVSLVLLLTLPTWSLLHEAIHGNLHPVARWNRRLGRLLAILYGAPFEALRSGHLLHHRYSRTEEISEAYDPRTTSWCAAAARHYCLVLGGVYWAEVLVGLLAWLPATARKQIMAVVATPGEISRRFAGWLDQPDVLAETRLDGLLAVALLVLAALLYREHWPTLLLALSIRALLIAFFDNAYHYGTAAGHPEKARNHGFPGNASLLTLHFNYHGVHHLHPTLPWFLLPAKASEIGAHCDGGFFSEPLRQLLGPIPLPALAAELHCYHPPTD